MQKIGKTGKKFFCKIAGSMVRKEKQDPLRGRIGQDAQDLVHHAGFVDLHHLVFFLNTCRIYQS